MKVIMDRYRNNKEGLDIDYGIDIKYVAIEEFKFMTLTVSLDVWRRVFKVGYCAISGVTWVPSTRRKFNILVLISILKLKCLRNRKKLNSSGKLKITWHKVCKLSFEQSLRNPLMPRVRKLLH